VAGRILQGVTQERYECEVADEPVVVLKARPMKASNGVEDKTKPTNSAMTVGVSKIQKIMFAVKGGSGL
jgi:hypothetical protein